MGLSTKQKKETKMDIFEAASVRYIAMCVIGAAIMVPIVMNSMLSLLKSHIAQSKHDIERLNDKITERVEDRILEICSDNKTELLRVERTLTEQHHASDLKHATEHAEIVSTVRVLLTDALKGRS